MRDRPDIIPSRLIRCGVAASLVTTACIGQGALHGDDPPPPAVIRLLDATDLIASVQRNNAVDTSATQAPLADWRPRGTSHRDEAGEYWVTELRTTVDTDLLRSLDPTPWRLASEGIVAASSREEALRQPGPVVYPGRRDVLVIDRTYNISDPLLKMQFRADFETTWVELVATFSRSRRGADDSSIEVVFRVNGVIVTTRVVAAKPAVQAKAEKLTVELPTSSEDNVLEIELRNVGFDLAEGGIRAKVESIAVGDPPSAVLFRRSSGSDARPPEGLEILSPTASDLVPLRWASRAAARHGRIYRPSLDPRFPALFDLPDGTTRSRRSLLLLPRGPVSTRLEVPPDAELHFDFAALTPGTVPATSLTVRLRDVASGVLLASHEMASHELRGVWTPARIDLSDHGGLEVELSFDHSAVVAGQVALVLGEPIIVRGRHPREQRPNIVIVSLDTLRGDHVGAYGYSRQTTPTIDRLAGEGVLFAEAFANSCWTTNSHQTMLTGYHSLLHTYETGSFAGTRVSTRLPTLASRLRSAGYRTAAFTGGGAVSAEQGFGNGFDQYDAYRRNFTSLGDSDRIVSVVGFDTAEQWVSQHHATAPFFLFLHTYAIHGPYAAPPEYDTFFASDDVATGRVPFITQRALSDLDRRFTYRGASPPPDEIEHIVRIYDRGIRYTDDALGDFVSHLESLGILDDTILVVTSDHGEQFWEHGSRGHATLYDEVTRVPLVVRYPKALRAGSFVAEQVSLVDLTPTVLSLAGLSITEDLHGRDLTPLLSGEPAAARSVFMQYEDMYGLRRPDRKLILERGGRRPAAEELYALDRDPGETENLLAGGSRPSEGAAEVFHEVLRHIANSQPGLNILVRGGLDFVGSTMRVTGSSTDSQSLLMSSHLFSRDFDNLRIATGTDSVALDSRATLISLPGPFADRIEVAFESDRHRPERPFRVGLGDRRGTLSPGGLVISRDRLAPKMFDGGERSTDFDIRLIGFDGGTAEIVRGERSESLTEQLRSLGYLD